MGYADPAKALANTAKWRKTHAHYIKAHNDRGSAIIRAAKDVPCADCKIKYAPCVMDFDHVRGVKIRTVGPMVGYKKEKILAEIAKCDVVCSNCHRMRTAARREAKKLPVE